MPEARPLLVEPARAPMVEVTSFGRCQPLRIAGVRASQASGSSLKALDGNLATSWNSGGTVPQAIELELAVGAQVAGVLMSPDMIPNFGVVTHVIETAGPSGAFDRGYVGRAYMTNGALYAMVFPRPLAGRYLRIRSLESPSHIAWREIVPFRCAGRVTLPSHAKPAAAAPAAAPPPPPVTPKPPAAPVTPGKMFRIVRGKGSCKTDDQCRPRVCCQASNCDSLAFAAKCRGPHGGACPASLGPLDYQGAGCLCFRGTCGAVFPTR